MEKTKVLSFCCNGLNFVVSAQAVVEVVHAVALVPLPVNYTLIRGGINYHGVVIPLFDLSPQFSREMCKIKTSDVFVIVNTSRRQVAILAEDAIVKPADQYSRMIGLRDLDEHAAAEYGIACLSDEVIFILDVEKLISDELNLELSSQMSIS